MANRIRRFLLRLLTLCLPACGGAVGSVASAASAAAGLEIETAVEGQAVALEAEVGGGQAPFLFQWYKDGSPIGGATEKRFALASVRRADAGLYAVVVSNEGGSAASLPVLLTVSAAHPSRLANVSIIVAAVEPVIVGFTLGGGDAGASNRLLARAAGPALGQLGVTGTLSDPVLELQGAQGLLAANDNWSGSEIAATAAAAGAFPFPAESRDAGLIADLPPGSFSARVTDAGGATGTTMVELYEVKDGGSGPASRFVNLSARATIGTNARPFTLGFTIEGLDPVRLLLRGVGPELARFGVGAPHPDPQLRLFRRADAVASNDNWNETRGSEIAAAAAAVGAFSLPSGSRDAAIVISLDPGSYTLQLDGAPGTAGSVLLELYEVP